MLHSELDEVLEYAKHRLNTLLQPENEMMKLSCNPIETPAIRAKSTADWRTE
jgi:hypothetical protein